MVKASPAEFVRQVRQETSKVTWPSRKETGMTTAMVFVMAALAAIFFLLIDKIITFGIELILGLGADQHGGALVYCSCLFRLREQGGELDPGTGGIAGSR